MAAYIRSTRNGLRRIIGETNFKSCSDGAINPVLYASQGVRFRKLDVILTTNVEKLGKAGESVKVAPGYFRNHLMPKLLAVPNIDKFARLIAEQRKIYQHEEEEEVKVATENVEDKEREYQLAAKRLDSTRVTIRAPLDMKNLRARASKDEPVVLREPVTKEFIVKEVARQLNVQIEPDNLRLPSPLTSFGEFEVPLNLPSSIPVPEGKRCLVLKVKIRGR